jgi:hypothetical protein
MDIAKSPEASPSYSAPRRSLKIPQAKAPELSTTQDKLSTREYVEHPGLDQVMLNYLDMEGILELYALNHETFETQEALSILTQRFNLGLNSFGKRFEPETFNQLLKRYDKTYATIRSYHGIDKSLSYSRKLNRARLIFLQAALEGNIQAVINGFKLYPGLVERRSLSDALGNAAIGGHEAIMDLLLDLGAKNKYNEIFLGAIAGGHVDLITGPKYKDLGPPLTEDLYLGAISLAVSKQQLTSLKYLFFLHEYRPALLNVLIKAAGETGNFSIINYLISRGANYYPELVSGAMLGTHFELAVKYLNQVQDGDKTLQTGSKSFMPNVIQAGRLDILKLLVKRGFVTRHVLNRAYRQAVKEHVDPDIITYLESLDIDLDQSSSSSESD